MMPRPPLTIDPASRSVGGWEAFVVWSTLNDARFNATVQVCDRCGLREVERLRALVGSYAHALDELTRRNLSLLQQAGPVRIETENGKIVGITPMPPPAPPEKKL